MTADTNRGNNSDMPNERDLDQLNELWDGVVAERRIEFSEGFDHEDRADAELIRALPGADSARDPDPSFLRDLRRSLMDISVDAGQAGPSPVGPAMPRSIPRPDRVPPRGPRLLRRLSGGSMRMLELAAVVALLLTMAGFAAGNDNIRGLFSSDQSDQSETTDAAMYLGNAAHTGEMPGPAPQGEIGLLWRAPNGSATWEPDSPPVIVDGVLYAATRTWDAAAGTVTTSMVAFDLASGATLWETVLPGFLSDGTNGGPVVADGIVYVAVSLERWLGEVPATPAPGATPEGIAHMAGEVLALDAQTGQEVWSYDELARAGANAPVVASGTLFIVSEDGILHALDAKSGAPRWMAKASDDPLLGFAASPTVSGDTVYVPGSDGKLHALRVEDGSEFWTAAFGGNQPTIAAVGEGSVYLAAYANPDAYPLALGTPGAHPAQEEQRPEPVGRLYAFDTADGTQRWSVEPGGRLDKGPTVAGDTVLLAGAGEDARDVVALSADDGQESWRFATEGTVVAPAVWSGSTVYVGSSDGNFYALNLESGEVAWQVAPAGFPISAAFVGDGVIAFASTDGNLYAVAATTAGAATPTAAEAADDISGLPPCTIEPRTDLQPGENGAFLPLEGTPAASIVPARDPAEGVSPTNLLFDEIPDGEAASQDVIDAIQATLIEMTGCDRPGLENQLAAYYSDDFFRRQDAYSINHLGVPGSYMGSPLGVPSAENQMFSQAILLPDGRVGTIITYPVHTQDPSDADGYVEYGWFVVWAESGGRWQIDEIAELSETPLPPG